MQCHNYSLGIVLRSWKLTHIVSISKKSEAISRIDFRARALTPVCKSFVFKF